MTSGNFPTSPQDLQSADWQHVGAEGFSGLVGGLWVREEEGQVMTAMVTGIDHANHYPETVHGGVIMTFADNALGYGVVRALGEPRCFTASLQTQFVSSAKLGEVISCRPEVVRKTRSLVFMRGLIQVGDRVVAAADGIWKVLDARGY